MFLAIQEININGSSFSEHDMGSCKLCELLIIAGHDHADNWDKGTQVENCWRRTTRRHSSHGEPSIALIGLHIRMVHCCSDMEAQTQVQLNASHHAHQTTIHESVQIKARRHDTWAVSRPRIGGTWPDAPPLILAFFIHCIGEFFAWLFRPFPDLLLMQLRFAGFTDISLILILVIEIHHSWRTNSIDVKIHDHNLIQNLFLVMLSMKQSWSN